MKIQSSNWNQAGNNNIGDLWYQKVFFQWYYLLWYLLVDHDIILFIFMELCLHRFLTCLVSELQIHATTSVSCNSSKSMYSTNQRWEHKDTIDLTLLYWKLTHWLYYQYQYLKIMIDQYWELFDSKEVFLYPIAHACLPLVKMVYFLSWNAYNK